MPALEVLGNSLPDRFHDVVTRALVFGKRACGRQLVTLEDAARYIQKQNSNSRSGRRRSKR